MIQLTRYTWWQAGAFWFSWLALLLPAYGAAFAAQLIGSLLPYYNEPVDIALVVIFGITLFSIVAIAIYTVWHYWHQSKRYLVLMSLVLIALVAIPLLASSGAAYLYTQAHGLLATQS